MLPEDGLVIPLKYPPRRSVLWVRVLWVRVLWVRVLWVRVTPRSLGEGDP
jgi:hypothetical protein